MDLLQGNIKKLYVKYLSAAFGSAMISSIYGIVDMAMVGQYQGPSGTAALAVVAPVWNVIYSLGLLTGVGGSVLMASAKGRGDTRQGNLYFTAAFAGTLVISLACWLAVIFFDAPLLRLFGADEGLLMLARRYVFPVKFAVPLFLFNQMLAAFLRNDNAPVLATAAVLAGGIFNIFGDWFFVFGLDMGIMGAGVATAMGAAVTFLVMITHFLRSGCSLRLLWKQGAGAGILEESGAWGGEPGRRLGRIAVTGFAPFFIDVAMGILTMLFNRQIVRYLGTDALAVYGVIVNISTVVQCCGYSVGQAAQPILSVNYGAGKWERIRQTLRYAVCAALVFGAAWTLLIWSVPNGFIRIFMSPTESVLRIAPGILRCYGLSFFLLPLNVFSTYYFQSLMKTGASFLVSVMRGMVLSGLLICLLPVLFRPEAVWLAMPVTELVTAGVVVWMMRRFTAHV